MLTGSGVQIGNACWELYTIEHGLSVGIWSLGSCEWRWAMVGSLDEVAEGVPGMEARGQFQMKASGPRRAGSDTRLIWAVLHHSAPGSQLLPEQQLELC